MINNFGNSTLEEIVLYEEEVNKFLILSLNLVLFHSKLSISKEIKTSSV